MILFGKCYYQGWPYCMPYVYPGFCYRPLPQVETRPIEHNGHVGGKG